MLVTTNGQRFMEYYVPCTAVGFGDSGAKNKPRVHDLNLYL